MRLHVYLDDELVHDLDARVGPRGRSEYIEEALRQRMEHDRRWELIRSAYGSISDEGHIWDPDPAAWVHESRRADPRRVG